MKKYAGKIVTVIQFLIFLFWILSGLGEDGLNILKLSILPIPHIGNIIFFLIMFSVIYGLQKIKIRLNVGYKDFFK